MADRDSVETYRSLRATIKHAAGEQPLTSVLVVDVDRNAPSEVARRLAAAFGIAGDACVLIETNFRAGSDTGAGLSELILDPDRQLDLKRTDGLAVVGVGAAGHPDLLSSKAFPSALDGIVEQFDYAIVTCDGYPATADALAIAPHVDAVILVISAGVTGREPAIQARDALERLGVRILGMVMIERPRRWF